MSNRRAMSMAAVLVGLIAAQPAAQAPSLDDVLQRSAAYVSEFRKQLSDIVAEETYRREIAKTARISNAFKVNPPRTLKSDLLLVKPDDSDRYVELRDVFEVDGAPVRNRESRLELLARAPSAPSGASIASIVTESARYNIGSITRNINTPLMTLQFLDRRTARC